MSISINRILRRLAALLPAYLLREKYSSNNIGTGIEAFVNDGDHHITINGKTIEMPASVREGLVFGDIFVVVLDVKYSMRNVFAFDGNGKQIWQIEDPEFEMPGSGYALVNGDDDILMALCRGGQFFINPKNGKIYDVYFDK